MRRHTIEVISLVVAAVGATASVFAWPDFRWQVLHDAKYKPEPPVVTRPETLVGGGVVSSTESRTQPRVVVPTAPPVAPPPTPPVVSTEGNAGEWYEIRAMSVQSSSVLPPSRVASYGPEMAVDGKWNTVWVEGADGDGSGDWIELNLRSPTTVCRVGIVNGYGNGPRYYENERVRDAVLTFSNGSWQRIHLTDNNDLQYFDVTPTNTQTVRLAIESVYPGTRWSDAAIGEIRVWGRH
ncbi:MAG TPA: discoidin domain-containing protein [Longimicrobium sp.]|nr:discoidin domain-containing protein [Longimicrobium sp.]